MSFGRKSDRIINIIDVANIVIGIVIVICTVFLFVDVTSNNKLFTVIFLLGMIMNICMAVKYYKRYDIPRVVAMCLFSVILLVLVVISIISIWIG